MKEVVPEHPIPHNFDKDIQHENGHHETEYAHCGGQNIIEKEIGRGIDDLAVTAFNV